MFNKVILWCEFPEKVDLKKLGELLNEIKLDINIYITAKNKKEFLNKKKTFSKIKRIKDIGVWPVLSKKEGYWFSGFTSKKNIDKLKEFSGLKFKIDLEPPLPNFNWNNVKIIWYGIKKAFQKGPNNKYLNEVIQKLKGDIILNEFPLPRWYLKKQGIYIKKEGAKKNLMGYSTIAGQFFRPFLKFYYKLYSKFSDNEMWSIGLIGSGIFNTEGTYKNSRQLKSDFEMVKDMKAKYVIVYSLEGILNRRDSKEWFEVVKEFS